MFWLQIYVPISRRFGLLIDAEAVRQTSLFLGQKIKVKVSSSMRFYHKIASLTM